MPIGGNAFRELLGTDLPVIQAPMAGVQGSELAIAVSSAGGLGSLPCAMLTPERMRKEFSKIREARLKSWNANFFCHRQPEPDPEREEAWIRALSPYYAEFGLDPAAVPAGAARVPFDEEAARLVEEFRPPVVSFHFGLPAEALLSRVRATGAVILASATTVAEAQWLEARGVSGIIAQGAEAGGHRGMFLSEEVGTQMGTFALVPQVAGAVRVPVIAAGGIADARGVEAALQMGAAAVQVGTSYLACPEATTSEVHRAALKSEGSRHTVITRIFTGRPARGIVNRLIREMGAMNELAPAFPLAARAIAPLRASAESKGDPGFSPLWCGENATGCTGLAAGRLTRELAGVFE